MFDTDEAFSFETLRGVSYAPYGGADIGEVMATAARITPGDWESRHREWLALADRIATIADKCAGDGHFVSAGSAYLRASNYYRTAEFFLRDDPSNDPRVADTSARAIQQVADQITCPTLVCEAQNDQFFPGQPRMLYEALRCPKTLLTLTAAEGAGEHCHEGALTLFHQRMFDWLDDTFTS